MVEPTMELLDWFRKQVELADGDVLQEMLRIFAETLMDTDASAACNAGFNEKSPERTNTRNGYRSRTWDTRAGTIDLAVPKLRQGSYFPLLAARAQEKNGEGAHSGSGRLLPCGRLHKARRQAGEDARYRGDIQVPGLQDGQELR